MNISKLLTVFLSLLVVSCSLFLLMITFPGCYTPSHEMEVWHIDSIHKSLKKSDELLTRADTHMINGMYTLFISNRTRLHKIDYNSLSYEDRDIVQQYESINDMFFQQYKQKYLEYSIRLDHSIKQLDSLKYNLTNNLIPRSTFETYFRRDKRIAVALNQEVFLFSKYTNNYKNVFNKLDPKILKICMRKKKN